MFNVSTAELQFMYYIKVHALYIPIKLQYSNVLLGPSKTQNYPVNQFISRFNFFLHLRESKKKMIGTV